MDKYYLRKLSIVSLCIGAIFFLAQDTIPLVTNSSIAAIEKTSHVKAITRVNLADTIIFHKNADTFFVDIREKKFYNHAHIAGAINIPANENTLKPSDETLARLKKASNVIIYGISSSDDKALKSAESLSNMGITGVKLYSEGWAIWKACELPMETVHE